MISASSRFPKSPVIVYFPQLLRQGEPYFVVVVEGQGTDFTVVWVGVLLRDVLEGTVGDVGVRGYSLLVLTALRLAHNLLRHLPQAHGAVSGPWNNTCADYHLEYLRFNLLRTKVTDYYFLRVCRG